MDAWNLPTELIQIIALFFDSPVDILNFSATCRQLGIALRVPYVFSHLLPSHKSSTEPDFQNQCAPWLAQARKACALWQICHRLDSPAGSNDDHLCPESAETIKLYEKLVMLTSTDDIGDMLYDRYDEQVVYLALGFGKLVGSSMSAIIARGVHHMASNTRTISSHYKDLIHSIIVSNFDRRALLRMTARVPEGALDSWQSDSQAVANLIYAWLLSSYATSRLNIRLPHAEIRTTENVNLARLDFLDMKPTLLSFWRMHPNLQTIGVYSHYTGNSEIMAYINHQDMPMETWFTFLPNGSITGHGSDTHGTFNILGSSEGETISFTKAYANYSYMYVGMLIPWGIAGQWFFPIPGLPLGEFWISML